MVYVNNFWEIKISLGDFRILHDSPWEEEHGSVVGIYQSTAYLTLVAECEVFAWVLTLKVSCKCEMVFCQSLALEWNDQFSRTCKRSPNLMDVTPRHRCEGLTVKNTPLKFLSCVIISDSQSPLCSNWYQSYEITLWWNVRFGSGLSGFPVYGRRFHRDDLHCGTSQSLCWNWFCRKQPSFWAFVRIWTVARYQFFVEFSVWLKIHSFLIFQKPGILEQE